MKSERHRAENADEFVFLRLNRLKSSKLCENLLRDKLKRTVHATLTDDVIKYKAIGLSSAVESAIGYWQGAGGLLNAKILSRYYFLLQMTIAAQVSNISSTAGLKEIQKSTEYGHGLGLISSPELPFPEGMYVFPLLNGHFYSYAKSIGIDLKSKALQRKPKNWNDDFDREKLISVQNLFRSIPELSRVVEEHLNVPPLAFHVGHSNLNMQNDLKSAREHMDQNGGITFRAPTTTQPAGEPSLRKTIVSIYSQSELVNVEYLSGLNLPLTDIRAYKDPSFSTPYIIGDLMHPPDIYWHQFLKTYSSAYATTTYAVPVWDNHYNSVATNYALLYSLSIIVRYMPDLWYRINTGDLNHIGSLIEYYIFVVDHILPLQMLEQITGKTIQVNSPGSFFGEI